MRLCFQAMHLRRVWLALGLLVAIAADAAVIYKWTDADGVIHFSDQAVPGAEKIIVSGSINNGIGGGSPAAPTKPVNQAPATALPAVIAISSPGKEQVFFNDDLVSVQLTMSPGLSPGQTLNWNLNGSALTEQANALSFSLPKLPRGTYTLTATVADADSGQTRSDSVTFYVRQPSELSPQHK